MPPARQARASACSSAPPSQAFSHSLPALGWSGLIVTVIWLVVAGVLAMVGKSELDKIKGLPKTQDTVKKIPNAATGHEEKNQ